jgi:hypothetical protein
MPETLFIILLNQLVFQGMFLTKNIILRRKIGKRIRGNNREATIFVSFFVLFMCVVVGICVFKQPFGKVQLLSSLFAMILGLMLLLLNLIVSISSLINLKDSWRGIINGRPGITISVVWKMGENLEPNWSIEEGYHIEIEGEPTLSTLIEFRQPSLPGLSREKYLMGLGMIATAMPIVNAIPVVCEATPGLRTYLDLPLICAGRSFYTG